MASQLILLDISQEFCQSNNNTTDFGGLLPIAFPSSRSSSIVDLGFLVLDRLKLLPKNVIGFCLTLLLLARAFLILDSRSGFHLPLFPLSIGGLSLVVVESGRHTSVSSLELIVLSVYADFLCSQRSN